MAARKEAINAPVQIPPQTLKFARWGGISVKHRRVGSGSDPEHWHTEHHIVLPIAGSFSAEVQSPTGKQIVSESKVGNVYVVPAGQPIAARSKNGVEYLSIYLDPALVDRAAADSMVRDQVEIVHSCGRVDPVIWTIGRALMSEAGSDKPAGRLYAESLANLLAVHLLRSYSSRTEPLRIFNGGIPGPRLRRAIDFISDNLASDVSLMDIATAADMSPYHFARAFKHATGLAPHQYLTKKRVDLAKELLAGTEMPLVEICYSVGLQSQSHFTTLFKRLTGLTPRIYRETNRRI